MFRSIQLVVFRCVNGPIVGLWLSVGYSDNRRCIGCCVPIDVPRLGNDVGMLCHDGRALFQRAESGHSYDAREANSFVHKQNERSVLR